MVPTTLTLTIASASKVLNRIQGGAGYSSEYLLKEATGEYRLKIRHSTEKNTIRGEKMDRHNVELSHTVYGTEPGDGYTVIVSSTIRNPDRITDSSVEDLVKGLNAFVDSEADDIVAWVS